MDSILMDSTSDEVNMGGARVFLLGAKGGAWGTDIRQTSRALDEFMVR